MFSDLRLLISATVAAFFLAAMASLYVSLRITHDQIAARTDGRAMTEDTPIARISTAWPSLEPGRAAALRDLARIVNYSPAVPGEPEGIEGGDVSAVPDITQPDTPATAPQDAAGSTGLAASPEHAAVNRSDIPGDAGTEKTGRAAAKKTPQPAKKKPVAAVSQRRKAERPAENPTEPPAGSGYPLYLTVPVTN